MATSVTSLAVAILVIGEKFISKIKISQLLEVATASDVTDIVIHLCFSFTYFVHRGKNIHYLRQIVMLCTSIDCKLKADSYDVRYLRKQLLACVLFTPLFRPVAIFVDIQSVYLGGMVFICLGRKMRLCLTKTKTTFKKLKS